MNELRQHILTLTSKERLHLASFILASLSEEEIEDRPQIPMSWVQEAQASVLRARSGEQPVFTWQDVKARIYGQ